MYTGPKTLPAIIEARATEEPDRPLVRFEDDVLTGAQLYENALRVANALTALGLRPGDKCALMLDNGREAIEAWFGMTCAGIVEVPINTAFKGDLLTYMLEQAECRAIIVRADLAERVEVDIPILVVGDSYDAGAGGGEARADRPRRRAARPVGDPLHLRHDRAVEGRRAQPQRELPALPERLGDHGLRARRGALHRVPALPRQRQVHDRAARALRRRRGGDAPALQRLALLGHLSRGGRHRLQLHGRAAGDAAQAAAQARRPRPPRAPAYGAPRR